MGAVSDVQSHLSSQGLIDGATGWPSTRRRESDELGEGQQVILTEDGGPAPEQPASSGLGSEALSDPGVQVRCRGARGDGDASYDRCKQIRDDLHGRRDETLGSTYYFRVRALGEIAFAGFDDQGRPNHTIAFRLMRDQN